MNRTRWCVVLTLLASFSPPPAGAAAAEVEYVSARLTGKVADAEGKPVPRATVMLNRAGGARVDLSKPWQVTAGDDGRYELPVRFERGKTLLVDEVFAEAKGFARAAPPVDITLREGAAATLDFVLARGEALAGSIRLPLTDVERVAYRGKEDTIRRLFYVEGPGVEALSINARSHLTDPGGRFEMYLPPGEYTLKAQYDGPDLVEWKELKTGRRDLVLELPPFEWSEAALGPAFDRLWEVMDAHYSYFFLKKDVDWDAVKAKYRGKVAAAKDANQLVAVLREMLAPLHDVHVWVLTPDGRRVGTYRGEVVFNGNREVTLARFADDGRTTCGEFAVVGRTKPDGFGYLLLTRQSAATPADVRKAVEAIRALRDAPGFVIDLRLANGGSEPLALEIAREFCATPTVYAKSKYRNGPGHDQFTREYERVLPAAAAGNPYAKPVVCLAGRVTVSSGEGFVKMMKCLPQVTLVGQPTRGASGNPKPFPLGRTGVSVYFSRWVDLMPDGRTFEGTGIAPDVRVDEPPGAYTDRDPTLDKGLAVLREKVAAAKK